MHTFLFIDGLDPFRVFECNWCHFVHYALLESSCVRMASQVSHCLGGIILQKVNTLGHQAHKHLSSFSNFLLKYEGHRPEEGTVLINQEPCGRVPIKHAPNHGPHSSQPGFMVRNRRFLLGLLYKGDNGASTSTACT